MDFYFDTNCIRQIRKLPSISKKNIVVSYLSIFETISGINSKNEFSKRKAILTTLHDKNIKIIWESPRSLLIKAFNLPLDDTDVEATRLMMEKIIKANDYNELRNVKINLGGEDYTINTFLEYDKSFASETCELLKFAADLPDKTQRAEYRKIEITPAIVQVYMEMMIRDFLLNHLSSGTSVESKQYIEAVNQFFQNEQLVDFLKSIVLGFLGALARGQNPSSNDGFDYGHLAYAHLADYFVSDDKFFQRIQKKY